MFSAMATKSKAKLLAAPQILVSDNREARIQVGQQVPIVTSETYGSTTIAPQRTIQYKDIGIILKVKPRINEGGLVSIELSQEISTYETITAYLEAKSIAVKDAFLEEYVSDLKDPGDPNLEINVYVQPK